MEICKKNHMTKKAYYIKKAHELRLEANALYRKAGQMANVVPVEQSLLIVGNYFGNERFDYCKWLDRMYDKADLLMKKADYYQEKADAQSKIT
ncbi:MAG: DUF3560 domain-containing protein [Gammaproteobacteria bacterium]|nr:DUF3560 domain-containing protein [Gammaproteobacteria bacterium]MBY0544816.1 DUF3560 domain-containing protein [Gammaproteobacteria bacterium]